MTGPTVTVSSTSGFAPGDVISLSLATVPWWKRMVCHHLWGLNVPVATRYTVKRVTGSSILNLSEGETVYDR